MRVLLIFAVLIGGPLFYLWEHDYSFRLHQRIAQLQEQRQRMSEVCDSLDACIANLSSKSRIEAQAGALGLRPQIERKPLLVAQALAAGPGKPKATAQKPRAPRNKPRVQAAKPPALGAKPVASKP